MYFFKKNHLQALYWLFMSMLFSCLNDVAMKYLATGLSFMQICFFRFALGSLVLLPLVGCTKNQSWTTQRPWLHFFRGLFLCLAMGLYAYGLTKVEMSTVTVIGFANPIFVLILARLLLKEQVPWPIWTATVLAFIGIVLVVSPTGVTCNRPALACLLATIVFASLDIINKKYVIQESILSMLFFSNVFAGLCMLSCVWYQWKMPTAPQLGIMTLLGIGSNLILYFVLKAFQLADAGALAPFRYMELVVSIGCGYLFFQESPTLRTCISAGIVIPATCFIAYHQNRRL